VTRRDGSAFRPFRCRRGRTLTLVEPLRNALRGAASDQVLYEVRPLDQLAGNSVASQRFLLVVFGVFAGLALLLACIGIYGGLAYVTNERVPEFGVRMALGATRRDVMRLVPQQSLSMLAIGTVVGLFVSAGLVATLVPAQRAARVDPTVTMHAE
jgi:ABC-type antimicrobial peptide transport system permease subunit